MSLADLLTTPEDQRNESWELSILELLPATQLKLLSQDPQTGPDGWPYILAETLPEGEQGELCSKLLNWLAEKGIGLVINPTKEYPDAVISYGMTWSFRQRGLLRKPDQRPDEGTIEFQPGQKIYTRPPDETHIPEYARGILRQFFQQQGVPKPEVLMISTDQENEDLCVSIQSLGSPPTEEHQGILEAISWFVPTDYSIALIDSDGLPEFVEL